MQLNVVLLQPEIPHNTGAIGRVCVGLDLHLHIVRPTGFSLTDRHLKRAGLDYWQHLRLTIHDSWEEFLNTESPDRMIFASTRGTTSYLKWKFKTEDYVVFGSETSGLPKPFYKKYADQLYHIPMPGQHARSINLANAASIILYEAYRQIDSR